MSAPVQDLCLTLLVSLFTLVLVASAYVRYCYGYWKRRNVPYLEPKFPFGNSTSLFPKGISIGAVTRSFYDKFKSMGHAVGGVYFGVEPKLVVLDPDLIRDILIKDFQNFTDRGVYQSESDPISVNIFSQPGKEWRNVRVKLTSVFTSAKMKAMFQTILDCHEGLEEALKELARQKSDVDILEVIGCFTTDVIESLRLWPPVATITRVCTKSHKLQDTGVTVEKGTTVLIPALGLHHDPEYWPDPEKWDPDRFSNENKDNRRPFTYLPFGEGPRNCIGLRFGLLQTKIALVTVLKDYRVSLSPKTILPLGVDPETFVLHNINRVYLLLDKI